MSTSYCSGLAVVRQSCNVVTSTNGPLSGLIPCLAASCETLSTRRVDGIPSMHLFESSRVAPVGLSENALLLLDRLRMRKCSRVRGLRVFREGNRRREYVGHGREHLRVSPNSFSRERPSRRANSRRGRRDSPPFHQRSGRRTRSPSESAPAPSVPTTPAANSDRASSQPRTNTPGGEDSTSRTRPLDSGKLGIVRLKAPRRGGVRNIGSRD